MSDLLVGYGGDKPRESPVGPQANATPSGVSQTAVPVGPHDALCDNDFAKRLRSRGVCSTPWCHMRRAEAADRIESMFAALIAARAELQEARRLNADLVRHLKLIEHATAPKPDDGGPHENAHTLAKQALSLNKWGVI